MQYDIVDVTACCQEIPFPHCPRAMGELWGTDSSLIGSFGIRFSYWVLGTDKTSMNILQNKTVKLVDMSVLETCLSTALWIEN